MTLGTIVEEHDHSGPLKGGGNLRAQSVTCRSFRLATAPTAGYALLADAAGVGTWQDIASAVPGIDLAAYFKLAGRAGGQIANGGTGATDLLALRGNSTTTPDRIRLVTRNATDDQVTVMEVQSIDGTKTPVTLRSNGTLLLQDPFTYSSSTALMLSISGRTSGTPGVAVNLALNGTTTAQIAFTGDYICKGTVGAGVTYSQFTGTVGGFGSQSMGPSFAAANVNSSLALQLDVSNILTTAKTWTVQNFSGIPAVCNSVPAGSVIYGTSTGVGFTALANGTAGQVLTSAGGTAAPGWQTPSGGGGSTFLDNVFRVQDDGDNTKQLALQVSGVTTATTRTWTVQDADGTVPLLERAETWSAIQTYGTAQRFSSDGTTADVMLLENSGGWDLLKCSKKATSWVDADAITTQFQIGDVSTTRHAVITGQGTTGSTFDRFGISSTYTLFSSGLHTVFPLKTANNEIFRIYQGSSDALEVCRIEIDRVSATGNILRLVSGRASTVDTIWNARNVMLQGRIKTDVLFTDDNATIASAKLLGLSVTDITAGVTRTWSVGNYSGYPAVPTNEGTSGQFLQSAGAGAQPTWHTLVAGDVPAHNMLSATHGDTLADTVGQGDLIVGNATPKWSRLAIGAAGRVLRSDSINPSWSQVVLTTDVTGTLPIGNGGTGQTTAPAGSIIYGNAGGTAFVALTNGTSGQVLTSSGGTAAPTWASPGGGTTHEMLSATHTDTTVSAKVRGGLLVVDSTPKWVQLALGTGGKYLRSDGTDALWSTIPVGDLPSHDHSGASQGGDTLNISDVSTIHGSATSSKKLRFEVDGLSASTTRVVTPQDLDGTMALLESPQTFTVTQTYNAPLALNEVSTPAAPSQNTGTIFTRQSPTDASNIQLCFIASSGAVCVICDLLDVNHVNTMLFNGIE